MTERRKELHERNHVEIISFTPIPFRRNITEAMMCSDDCYLVNFAKVTWESAWRA